MSALAVLVPISLVLGLVGLGAFLWSLRTRQYEDLDGAAERVLLDGGPGRPAGERGGTTKVTAAGRLRRSR